MIFKILMALLLSVSSDSQYFNIYDIYSDVYSDYQEEIYKIKPSKLQDFVSEKIHKGFHIPKS